MYAKRNLKYIIIITLLSIILLAGCSIGDILSTPSPSAPDGTLLVHFIDVGQADCILAQLPNGETMLIDAGNNNDGTMVVDYLQNAGIDTIDYVIGTHPHEDHIGGLDDVIKSFEIEHIYLPKVSHTTKTYRDVLTAIQDKHLTVNTAKAGVTLLDNSALTLTILAPNRSSYEDLNNYSAVLKLTYGKTNFLFTGDAEELSEKEILKAGWDVKADVLKVGHHGSVTSTSAKFLQAVDPTYAVICAGQDNDYGHPHKEILQRLQEKTIFRTDLNGTIVFTSDGQNITVAKEK